MQRPPWLKHWRVLLILPPVVIGIAVLAWAASRAKGLPRREVTEEARVLRVIQVPELDVVPRVLGYGTVRPRRIWQAVSEVSGRIIEVHQELRAGAIIREGEQLFRVDPVEFELAIQQLQADITQATSKLAELDAQEENYRASLAIEVESLSIAEADLQRKRSLAVQNAAASAEVESAQRAVLTQRQSVQRQRSALNLVPAQRASLEAALAAKRVALQDAQRNLKNTVVLAPLTCRLGDVNLDVGQYVVAGQPLLETDGVQVVDIDAQVPLERFIEILDVDKSEYQELLSLIAKFDLGEMRRWFMQRSSALVRLRSGDFRAQWDANLSTIRERLDPQTRTVGIVVEVEDPMQKIIPGERPLLVKGMFCEIELRGSPRPNRLVIPRLAIHNGHVFVVDGDNRLQQREVEIELAQGSFAVVRAGLQTGETVIVSDPTPAILGMLVEPIEDPQALDELIAEATGKGARS